MDDEFEFEVTDLRTGRRVEHTVPLLPSRPPASGRADVPPEQTGARVVAPGWLRERWANRRTLGAVGTLAALIVIAALVLATVPNSQATLRALLHLPTPGTSAAVGAGTFYATRTVPWGRLLSDGQQLAPLRDPDGADLFQFNLTRGTHMLRYDAPPFPSLTCRVSVPASPHDTCPLASGPVLIRGSVPGAMAERTLDMGVSLDRLPHDEQVLLVKAAGSALSQQVGMTQGLAGDHYLASDGTVASAPGPFHGALVYTLNLDTNRIAPNMPPKCVTLCEFGVYGPAQGYWPVKAHVTVSWRYTFADGATATSLGVPQAVASSDILVALQVMWKGQWQVTLATRGEALCGFAFSAVSAVGGSASGIVGQPTSGMATGGQNLADGCFIDLSSGPEGGGTYLLYRFGLLLAVNAPARQWFPTLPQANAHEQALAHQMAQPLYPWQLSP
jgi:hypothetical protein